MKTIVFFNNKGGVGKTTLTCNVVSYLNIHLGKKVLLIDADPQCNATQAVLEDDTLEDIYTNPATSFKSLYTYLRPLNEGDAEISSDLQPIHGADNEFATDLIPGHPEMSLIEDKLSRAWSDLQGADPIRGYRISNWLSQLLRHVEGKYDYVVFDVGPSLGALNRTILLNSDYVVTPFGSDIFSILGIRNISSWIKSWSADYSTAVANAQKKDAQAFTKYPGVVDPMTKFRLAGYSVQQYVTRKFKEGRRPVKAYDEIMQSIPENVTISLGDLFPDGLSVSDLELGHIPFLYSLVPLAQSHRAPIHALAEQKAVVGSQVRQVDDYVKLMDKLCKRLLANVGDSPAAGGVVPHG